MIVHLIDQAGKHRYSGDESNPKVAQLEGEGYARVPSAPPNDHSVWNGSAWVDDAEVLEARRVAGVKRDLLQTDDGMARVLEDLIAALKAKLIISDSDLPQMARDKIAARVAKRSEL
jgi:hypothetical protein